MYLGICIFKQKYTGCFVGIINCSYLREKLQLLTYKFYLSISQTSSRSNGNSEFNCSLKNKKIDLNEKFEFSANKELFAFCENVKF